MALVLLIFALELLLSGLIFRVLGELTLGLLGGVLLLDGVFLLLGAILALIF